MTIIAVILLLLGCSWLFFHIYAEQDRFRSMFKHNLEGSFAEMTGADVRISAVSGNPFKKIIFKGLNFDFSRYDLDFEIARLEYSLFDVITGRKSAANDAETVMSLGKGSLRLENNTIISRKIKGKVRLKKGIIILESINFSIFGQLSNSLEGEIITESKPYRLELILESRPFFKKDKPLLDMIRIKISGSPENLNLRGKIETPSAKDIHFRSYIISEKELLNIGTRIGIETEQADIDHVISMDTEFDTDTGLFSAILLLNKGRVAVKGDCSDWYAIKADIENQHLKVFGFDFSNIIHFTGRTVFKGNSFSHFLVDADTEASVFNYHPIDEMESSFFIDKSSVRALYLKVGDKIAASGNFNIKPPRKAKARINFSGFNLQTPYLLADKNPFDVSGMLSGEITIKGLISRPGISANLSLESEHFGNIYYDKIWVNAEGQWPYLRIYDSRITYSDSSLMFEGEVDIRRFSEESFMDDVAFSTSDNTVKWEGWDITRTDQENEFSLKKGLESGFKVGFKRYMEDETKYEANKQSRDEFQLEYDLLNDQKSVLQFKAKEDEEFFGFKKRYSF